MNGQSTAFLFYVPFNFMGVNAFTSHHCGAEAATNFVLYRPQHSRTHTLDLLRTLNICYNQLHLIEVPQTILSSQMKKFIKECWVTIDNFIYNKVFSCNKKIYVKYQEIFVTIFVIYKYKYNNKLIMFGKLCLICAIVL